MSKYQNTDPRDQCTQLYLAARNGDLEHVKELVSQGAKLDEESIIYRSKMISKLYPMHAAAYSHNFEVIRYLIEKGARIDVENSNGQTPLIYAFMSNDFKMDTVTLLYSNESDIKTLRKFYSGIINNLFDINNTEALNFIIEKEIKFKEGRIDGLTAILAMLSKIDNDAAGRTFEIVLNRISSELPEEYNKILNSLVNIIAIIDKPIVLRNLLAKGAELDPKQYHKNLEVAANYAATTGNFVEADHFLKKGASLIVGLHRPVYDNDFDVVAGLLERGVDINSELDHGSWKGYTPLGVAVRQGHTEMVKFLLDKGANPNPVKERASFLSRLSSSSEPKILSIAKNGKNPEIINLIECALQDAQKRDVSMTKGKKTKKPPSFSTVSETSPLLPREEEKEM